MFQGVEVVVDRDARDPHDLRDVVDRAAQEEGAAFVEHADDPLFLTPVPVAGWHSQLAFGHTQNVAECIVERRHRHLGRRGGDSDLHGCGAGSHGVAHHVGDRIGRLVEVAGRKRGERSEVDVDVAVFERVDRPFDVWPRCPFDEGLHEELHRDFSRVAGGLGGRHARQVNRLFTPLVHFVKQAWYLAWMPSVAPDLRIDIDRLRGRIDALAEIGEIEGTHGCARLALTDEDRAGRDLVVTWMRDLGLDIQIDGIGNVVGIFGDLEAGAPVMCGSHIDTVRTGGRYDGNLGVLAGLEIVETLQQAGVEPARPLAVAFFTDEEGARFPPDMLGSLVYVGGMALEEALDITGIDGPTVGEELDRIGYAGSAPLPGLVPHAFVELHVEQGPVLEVEGITVGAVDGVQGISWQEVTVTGQSNHAGTTPMSMRRDPGVVAAAAVGFARSLATELGHPQVATCGRVEFRPNLVNVVPASATFTIDLRNTDDAVLVEAEQRMAAFLTDAAEAEGCTIETRTLARFEPVIFDPAVVDLVEQTAHDLGHSVRRMPSGAGHDAQMLARVCPTAMVFTPSENGLSHNPAEFTSPADLEAGANVLLHTMLSLAHAEIGMATHD